MSDSCTENCLKLPVKLCVDPSDLPGGAGCNCGIATTQTPGLVQPDGETIRINNDGVISLASLGNVRIALTGPHTIYVRPDGDDNNDGMYDTANSAFATPQAAFNYASTRLDLQGHLLTVQVADGTYPELNIDLGPFVGAKEWDPFNTNFSAGVLLQGQGKNTIISGVCIRGYGNISVTNLQSKGANANFRVMQRATLYVCGDIWLGASSYGFTSTYGGTININGPTITALGNISRSMFFAAGPCESIHGSANKIIHSVPCVLDGAYAYALAYRCSCIYLTATTFSGSVTGKRYICALNGVIDTSSNNANYFPGTIAGTVGTGGVYS